MKYTKRATIIILTLIALAAEIAAQGSRIMLTQLERAPSISGSRKGMIGLSNANGDQRYAFYVNVADTCINYTPADTGNATVSIFVQKCTTDSIWYIDYEGRSILLAPYGAAADTCDVDWLEIADNNCPDALTDSIYKYKYASIGARYVWPGAELLVNDSVSSGIAVVQGSRNARLALYDSQSPGTFFMIDHGGSAPVMYMPVNANLVFKTTAGTPQTPVGSQVNHFAINTQDSTIQMNQYPRTRVDTQEVQNFLYTDPVGKVRSRDVAYLSDTLGFGANIYNVDGFFPPDIDRQARLDTLGSLSFYYPSGHIGIQIYGGDDSTAVDGYARLRGPGEISGNVRASEQEVIVAMEYPDSESYAGFTQDDPGITVVIDNVTPEQGQILLSNPDGVFHFAALDTLSVPNIYNSNGSIPPETERTVTLSSPATLIFSVPVDGGDLNLLEVVSGDASAAGSSVTVRAGTDGDENRFLVEDQVGINGYWQDATEVRFSDNSEANFIWQSAAEFHAEGSAETATYYIIGDNSVPTLYMGIADGTTETELDMDAETGEESFMLRCNGDNGDLQAFVSGTLATVSTTAQTVIAAYDVSAPQFTLNEIRIDTAGVGILTRGGVGNDGDVLYSNGEKSFWGPAPTGENIYTDNGTIDAEVRTVTLSEDGQLVFAYNNAEKAVEIDDFGTVKVFSKDGESSIEVSTNGMTIEASGTTESIEINANDGSVFIGASATVGLMPSGDGIVSIGASGTPTQLFFADADGGNHGTYIVAGSQADNVYYELPSVAGTDGQVLTATGTTALVWEDPVTEGILSADQLSWAAGPGWQPVNANRALFVQASGTITPSVGVTEIIVNDTATTSTVNLNYVPGDLDGASYAQPFTTVRYVYNWGSGDCTVDTNQDWLFRTQGAGSGATTLTIPTGQAYKLVWVQGSTEANSRFWCFRIN